MKWVRASDGAIFGVCKGLARTLGISVGLFRLMWILSVLFLGAGVGLYLILAIGLPREDKAVQALEPWILGVCSRVALRTDLEVGIVRVLAIFAALLSMGATVVGYFVLYFVLDDAVAGRGTDHNSETRPSTPPMMI